jgi:hypothetical protein
MVLGVNGAAGVLAASVAVATSIALSIDTTLRIGAACYLLGRRSRNVIDVRRRPIQPHHSPIPAPERAYECIGYRVARRRGE